MATAEESDRIDDGDEDRDGADSASESDSAVRNRTTDNYTRKNCVLITGCSSGIGRATARAFLEEDWRVVATARNIDDIGELAEVGCDTATLDVTEPGDVATVVEETVENAGALDCVVNNAGYGQFGPLEDVPTSTLHRQFDVNVYGPHRLTRAALPHMRAQGEGRIINVSSILGRLSFAGTGAYSGSKHALEAMSDSLRNEVEEFELDVILVEPGTVETEFANRVGSELPEKRTPAYEAQYDVLEDAELVGGSGPLAITPKQVAAAIVHAATTPDPPARYPVGPMAQYGQYARFLPDSIRDALYGLVRRLV